MIAVSLPVCRAQAAEDQGLKNAIAKAKTIFKISNGYDNFHYSLTNQGGKTLYYLSWDDTKNKLGHVDTTIDSNGFVSSYSHYVPYSGSSPRKLPAVSKDDAQKKANAFILRVNPSLKGKFQYQQENSALNIMDTSYNFRFLRIENGVPFQGNNVMISVDRMSGDVQSFYCNWYADVEFPEINGIIDTEKAQQTYKEKMGLRLYYKFSYSDDGVKPYLVYAAQNSNGYIDARTGDIFQSSSYGYPMAEDKAKQATGASVQTRELTPKEREAVENAANFLSDKKAEERAREFLKLDSTYKLGTMNLYGGWSNTNDYTWNMDFYQDDSKGGTHASISIDAANGEIRSFYRYAAYDQNAQVKYGQDEALVIAQDFIKTMQPDKSDKVEYLQQGINPPIYKTGSADKPTQYTFNFIRKEEGAYVENDGFSITVDTISGGIIQYGLTWYKGELPSADHKIDVTKAYDILFGTVGIQLQYVSKPADSESKVVSPIPYGGSSDVVLAYVINPQKPANIDANTGKLLGYNGEVYTEYTPIVYNDIQGATGENQIKVLAQYGIALPGENFKPQQKVTQKEFLYLLAKSTSYYLNVSLTDPKSEDALYNYLQGEGIIKETEKAPTASVTKEEAVKYIIRALKCEKIADIKGIYALPFIDKDKIDPMLRGYIAIAYGLNIIDVNNGIVNPKGELSREQAVIMLYNFLNNN